MKKNSMDRFCTITEFEKLCAEYKENKNMIKELEDMNAAIRAAILAEMGDTDTMTRGSFTVTNKPFTRTDIDKKRLETEKPDIYRAYLKTSTFPRFVVR